MTIKAKEINSKSKKEKRNATKTHMKKQQNAGKKNTNEGETKTYILHSMCNQSTKKKNGLAPEAQVEKDSSSKEQRYRKRNRECELKRRGRRI